MDRCCRWAEVATEVIGFEPIRFPCVGLHESHGVRTLGEHESLLRRILSAARRINSAAVLRKVTRSLVTQVGKCIQADGGHFEQPAWVVNYITVTVQLATIFNKQTLYFFPFYFIQFTVNTRSPVNAAIRTQMYMTLLVQNFLWN
jgi:hypothetical protein